MSLVLWKICISFFLPVAVVHVVDIAPRSISTCSFTRPNLLVVLHFLLFNWQARAGSLRISYSWRIALYSGVFWSSFGLRSLDTFRIALCMFLENLKSTYVLEDHPLFVISCVRVIFCPTVFQSIETLLDIRIGTVQPLSRSRLFRRERFPCMSERWAAKFWLWTTRYGRLAIS